MLRKSTLALALGLACSAHGAWALGLGGMRTQSALNQPFYAEIDLFDVDGAALDTVKVRLASREEFDRAGTDRPHFLTRLRFTPMVGPRGEPMVQVTSREPVREPYLNFFVEVLWPEGRLVKEYTVLLDPPVTSAEQAPRIAQPRISAPVRRPPPQPEPLPMRRAAPEALPAVSTSAAAESSPVVTSPTPVASTAATARPVIPVQAADTDFPVHYGPVPSGAGLWRIARNLAPPGATVAQTAMALYRNNADAFVRGDINKLKVGADLSIPTAAELFALDADSAEAEFRDALAGRAVTDAPITDVEAALRIAGAPSGTDATEVDDKFSEAEGPASDAPEVVGQLEGDLLLVRETSEANRQETQELRERIRELEDQLTDIRRLLELRNEQLQQMQAAVLADPAETGSLGDLEPASLLMAGTAGSDTAAVDSAKPLLAGDEPAAGGGTVLGPPPAAVAGDGDAVKPPAVAQQAALQAEPVVHELEAPSADEASLAGSGAVASLRAIAESLPPWSLAAGAGALVLGGVGVIVGRRRRRLATEQALLDDELSIDLPDDIEALPLSDRTQGVRDSEVGLRAADQEAAPASGQAFVPAEGSLDALLGPVSIQPRGGLQEPQEADVLSEVDIYILYGRYREAEHLLLEEMDRSPERVDLRYKLAEVHAGNKDREALSALVERMEAADEAQFDAARWQTITEALADMGGPMPRPETEPERERGRDDIQRAAVAPAVTAAGPVSTADDPSGGTMGLDDAISGGAEDAGLDGAMHGPGDVDELELDLDELDRLGALDDPIPASAMPPREDTELTTPAMTQRQGQAQGDDAFDIDLEGLGALGDLEQREIPSHVQGLASAIDKPDLLPDPRPGDGATVHEDVAEHNVSHWSTATAEGSGGELPSNQWRIDAGLWDEASTKMDLARAYIEIEDPDAARTILEEVVHEGSDEQRTAAKALLARIA